MLALILAETFIATAYSMGCGGTGFTKSGTIPQAGYTLAVDPKVIAMGSLVRIRLWDEGALVPFAHTWRAEDTGRKIKGRHVDLFLADCQSARAFGVRHVRVELVGHKKIKRHPGSKKRLDRRGGAR
jgi:3D (Asp-Asp-Asp) domain-containing protein